MCLLISVDLYDKNGKCKASMGNEIRRRRKKSAIIFYAAGNKTTNIKTITKVKL